MCIWSSGDFQVSSVNSNKSEKKSQRNFLYNTWDFFFFKLFQVKVKPLVSLNWREIMLVLNIEKTQQINKQTITLIQSSTPCLCVTYYHLLEEATLFLGLFLSLPNLLFCCCAHPAWARSFIHLVESREPCALCSCPLRLGTASFTNGERPLTWLSTAQSETSGLGFILPKPSHVWCDVCLWSVSPVIVGGDPVCCSAEENGWCFNLTNGNVSLCVIWGAFWAPRAALMSSALATGSNTVLEVVMYTRSANLGPGLITGDSEQRVKCFLGFPVPSHQLQRVRTSLSCTPFSLKIAVNSLLHKTRAGLNGGWRTKKQKSCFLLRHLSHVCV